MWQTIPDDKRFTNFKVACNTRSTVNALQTLTLTLLPPSLRDRNIKLLSININ